MLTPNLPAVQDIFNECAAELGLKGFKLVTTKKDFERLTGTPVRKLIDYSATATISPSDKIVWIHRLWLQDRLNDEYQDIEEVRVAMYHELLHAKHPSWSERQVSKEASRLATKSGRRRYRTVASIPLIIKRRVLPKPRQRKRVPPSLKGLK